MTSNENVATTLYAVYSDNLKGTVKLWEDLTMDQRQAWQKVAETVIVMSAVDDVFRMEDINSDLRDALWVVMRHAAKALNVEIAIVDA